MCVCALFSTDCVGLFEMEGVVTTRGAPLQRIDGIMCDGRECKLTLSDWPTPVEEVIQSSLGAEGEGH